MAKKFGKFLLVAAGAAAVGAGVYYYLKKKSEAECICDVEDEDYDDFSEEDLDATVERTYVPLDLDGAEDLDFVEETVNGNDGDFAPLADQLQEKNDEQVEEFFGEEETPADAE